MNFLKRFEALFHTRMVAAEQAGEFV